MSIRLDAQAPRAGPPRAVNRALRRRGFTLIESLMATGLLLMVVVAVTSAITAGQQNAYEAHQRIAAALVAEELMSRIASEPYDQLNSWDGFAEDVGELLDMSGTAMPSSFQMVGRDARVVTTMNTLTGLDVRVRGKAITVRAFNRSGRVLATINRFVPEPQP